MPRHPAEHLDISEPSRSIFDVGLEVVFRIVVASMAFVLLFELQVLACRARPKLRLAKALPQLKAQTLGADQGPRL